MNFAWQTMAGIVKSCMSPKFLHPLWTLSGPILSQTHDLYDSGTKSTLPSLTSQLEAGLHYKPAKKPAPGWLIRALHQYLRSRGPAKA